jgi:hypothetical protein
MANQTSRKLNRGKLNRGTKIKAGLSRYDRTTHEEAEQDSQPPLVTVKNRHRYVELYTRRRYYPPAMRESVLAIRRGLLRVRFDSFKK